MDDALLMEKVRRSIPLVKDFSCPDEFWDWFENVPIEFVNREPQPSKECRPCKSVGKGK
jgi:hypothetical protein